MAFVNRPKKKVKKGENQLVRHSYYNTSKWRKLSNFKKMSNPLCEKCLENNIIRQMDDVHHIISFMSVEEPERTQLMYDYQNLISVCRECHQKIHNPKRDKKIINKMNEEEKMLNDLKIKISEMTDMSYNIPSPYLVIKKIDESNIIELNDYLYKCLNLSANLKDELKTVDSKINELIYTQKASLKYKISEVESYKTKIINIIELYFTDLKNKQ